MTTATKRTTAVNPRVYNIDAERPIAAACQVYDALYAEAMLQAEREHRDFRFDTITEFSAFDGYCVAWDDGPDDWAVTATMNGTATVYEYDENYEPTDHELEALDDGAAEDGWHWRPLFRLVWGDENGKRWIAEAGTVCAVSITPA